MKKIERQIEVLVSSLLEVVNIEKVIDSLPRGYISVKSISGHTYYYRQWREGNKIISSYVPETHLNIIKQKIEIRKQNEELLRIVKKDFQKSKSAIIRSGLLDEDGVMKLKERLKNIDPNSDYSSEIDAIKNELIK